MLQPKIWRQARSILVNLHICIEIINVNQLYLFVYFLIYLFFLKGQTVCVNIIVINKYSKRVLIDGHYDV